MDGKDLSAPGKEQSEALEEQPALTQNTGLQYTDVESEAGETPEARPVFAQNAGLQHADVESEAGETPEVQPVFAQNAGLQHADVESEAREATLIYVKNDRQSNGGGAKKTPRERSGNARPGLLEFTLFLIYKNLYVLGILLLRRKLVYNRRCRLWRSKAREAYFSRLDRILVHIKRFLINFRTRVRTPVMLVRRTYREALPEIRQKRAKGQFPIREYLTILEPVARLVFKIISTIFNYTAPVAAAFVFLYVVGQRLSEPMILAVDYKGQTIGYIQNESDFSAATQDVQSRLTTDGENAFTISPPHFELMTVNEFNTRKASGAIPAAAGALNQQRLADKLIAASGDDVSEAYGLYVNNRFLGAVTEKEPVLSEFQRLLDESKTGKPDEVLRFSKRIRFRPGLYPKKSLTDEEAILSVLAGFESFEETYVVKTGDSPSVIADKIGVPLDILTSLNPDIEEKMFEGYELLTNVAKPYLPVESIYTDFVEEDVAFETVEVENAQFTKGFSEVFQEGVDGLRRVKYRVTSENGLEKSREEVSYEMLRHPVAKRVTVGIADPTPPSWSAASGVGAGSGGTQAPATPPSYTAPPSNAQFIRPVPPGVGYISCYLGGYPGHTGIDIAVMGGTGTPILAAASGTVVKVQNSNVGYGRHLIIDHGNGYQTYYAHNSAMYVSVGQYVQQGQVIAAMGRTGNATGVHLHFEVRYNGRVLNPCEFIGYR